MTRGLAPSEFRRLIPELVHYAPAGLLRLDAGLLTASQVLDRSTDEDGHVWARFPSDLAFRPYDVDHWKSHARFKRGAGEAGSNLIVRDAEDRARVFVLGNNFPLGNGMCIGTTIPLTDNRPGDDLLDRAGWFLLLNGMVWFFDPRRVNVGVLEHLRGAAPDDRLSRVSIPTAALSDEFIEERVRLSAINGGGSNGGFSRGTRTYKSPSEWVGTKRPKEIGIVGGVTTAVMATLDTRAEHG